MKTAIRGKNLEITKSMAEHAEKALSRLNDPLIVSKEDVAHILVRTYHGGEEVKVEVTINNVHGVLRAESTGDDYYVTMDDVASKLKRQIQKCKTRYERKHHYEKLSRLVAEEEEDDIIRTKTIEMKLMGVGEAVAQMEMLDHDFYVYIDDETCEPAVVYRRHEGGYGLIETQHYQR